MTVKKFIAITSAALAATVLTASAQVAVGVTSAYIFRGATLNDEVNVQPGFETTALSGLVTVGTWANFNTDTSEFDEIDYYFSIPLPLGEESPVSVKVGYTEYTYPGTEGDADREPFVSFGTSVDVIDLGLLVAYGVDGLVDSSLYLQFDASTELPVAENIAVKLTSALGYSDPDEGESGFSHLTLGTSVALGIPETEQTVSLGVSYVVETDKDVLEVDEDWFFTVGLTL
jgi:uncharacterized protein (TIGR02001 family)